MSDESDSPEDATSVEPPLSIAHLMLWAACVAVYLSVVQTATQSYELPLPLSGTLIAFWAIGGLIQGTGLAAILLLVVRRFRGIRFPRHGGEMLWIIVGIQAVMSLFRHLVFLLEHNYWIARYLSFRLNEVGTILFAYGLFNLIVWAGVYLYAILQTKTRRWRVVFSLMLVAGIAVQILIPVVARVNGLSAMMTISTAARFFQQAVVVVSLLVASWIDLRQPHRYPWTHWTGVILYLLRFTGTVLAFVALFLMGR